MDLVSSNLAVEASLRKLPAATLEPIKTGCADSATGLMPSLKLAQSVGSTVRHTNDELLSLKQQLAAAPLLVAKFLAPQGEDPVSIGAGAGAGASSTTDADA